MKKTLGIGVALLTLIVILLIGKWAMVARNEAREQEDPQTPSVSVYNNGAYGISLSYPSNVVPETDFKAFYHLSRDWRVGEIGRSQGTPLVAIPLFRIDHDGVYSSYPMYYSAELRVGVSTSTDDVSSCLTGGEENNLEIGSSPTTTMINGIEWTKIPVGSAGMMQYVYGNSYRLVRGDTCITVETLKAGSNYRDTPSIEDISDADLETYYSDLDAILQTVQVDFTGARCGGNIQNAPACPSGYHCQLQPVVDLGGSCVRN